jgi:hypothetical protein
VYVSVRLLVLSVPPVGEGADGNGAVGALPLLEISFVLTEVDLFVVTFDVLAARSNIASEMPMPQSMTAVNMRGLTIPDLEDGSFFIDEWVMDCVSLSVTR